MKNLIVITFIALFIQGCATTYQKAGFTGGYSETQLDENVFRISFRGNGYTSRERVADFTLLRSAELALENGFQYFTIIDANSYTSYSTYKTPTKSYTTGSAYESGNYVYGNATTTTSGGQTYHISKPSSLNTIVCFKDKPENIFAYNANFINKNIKQKYGINNERNK
ncbi:MAG: hypothetical protein J7K40_10465 [candidate division Zixibacteria bacterium]|nr:hypothetical protein [candidate division Zixibacteria bacterium]